MSERLALNLTQDLAVLEGRGGPHSGCLMNSSEDLIAEARAGDPEAFRLIFERYARPVLSFIYDLVGQRALAEELVQETFVRAYQNLQNIRDDTRLSSWLFGIGRNVARESLRSRFRHEQRFCGSDQSYDQIRDLKQSPADDLLQKEFNAAMRDALHTIDEDRRTVFVLKVFQQQSYQEIVEITGFSLAKVKTDLHRARLEIKARMRPFLENER